MNAVLVVDLRLPACLDQRRARRREFGLAAAISVLLSDQIPRSLIRSLSSPVISRVRRSISAAARVESSPSVKMPCIWSPKLASAKSRLKTSVASSRPSRQLTV
jgi:hypothetical protein